MAEDAGMSDGYKLLAINNLATDMNLLKRIREFLIDCYGEEYVDNMQSLMDELEFTLESDDYENPTFWVAAVDGNNNVQAAAQAVVLPMEKYEDEEFVPFDGESALIFNGFSAPEVDNPNLADRVSLQAEYAAIERARLMGFKPVATVVESDSQESLETYMKWGYNGALERVVYWQPGMPDPETGKIMTGSRRGVKAPLVLAKRGEEFIRSDDSGLFVPRAHVISLIDTLTNFYVEFSPEDDEVKEGVVKAYFKTLEAAERFNDGYLMEKRRQSIASLGKRRKIRLTTDEKKLIY